MGRGWKLALTFGVVALAWRLVLCFVVVPSWQERQRVVPAPDRYPALAQSLVADGVFGYGDDRGPTTVRGPGFASWLAAGLLIGGTDPRWLGFWGGIPEWVLAVVMVGLLRPRLGSLPALVAGSVAALHPLPSLISARVMGDGFYAAVGLAGLAVWLSTFDPPGPQRPWLRTVVAGSLLAWQLLCRSSGILTVVVGAATGLLHSTPDVRRRAAGLLLIAITPAIGWSIRSSRLEGRIVFVHSLAAYNFWVGEGFERLGNYTDAVGFAVRRAGIDGLDADRFWYGDLTPRQAAELDGRLSRQALRHLTDHPASSAMRAVRGIWHFWVRAQSPSRTLQYGLVVVPVLVLAAFGAWRSRRCATWGRWATTLVAVIVLHNVAYAVVFPMARFSVQVYPAVALLAGLGVWQLVERVRPAR